AHGMYSRYYINYSITCNRVLTADNIFRQDAHDEVLQAVNNAARRDFEGQLSVDTIPDYSVIRISDNDIYFVYQPYEIASYARGVVEIPVGIYELVDALSPLGRDALGVGKYD
ncbi:MAG: RsiV family protein, partial [Muribaculaceae bacterium]|nr:RsiV family protein [Muribaculaceae bacterium]